MVRVLRWICKKCNKKWIYPLDECIYCYGKLEKEVGKKTKVIGNTKVIIPSPLHPIIPYNVLILEDEHGNKMPKKVMVDYKIGDVYEDKPYDGKDGISIVKIKYDMYEAVTEAIELIGDMDVKGKKVLIKPNMSIGAYPYQAMTTNPAVIEAIIQYLKENKAKEIAIAEQSFFMPMKKCVKKNGLAKLAKDIEFVDLSKEEFELKGEGEFQFEVWDKLDEYDLILNVPVIKTDMLMGISGAIENLIRFISPMTFQAVGSLPQEKLVEAAIALMKELPLDKIITIGDGSIGMQGNGPAQHGEPGFYNIITAARNIVTHDKVIQEMFLLRKLPYVEQACKEGLGEIDISKIKVVGNELKAMQHDIKQPIGSKLIKNNE